MFKELKSLAAGKTSVLLTVRLMKDITERMAVHTAATGDYTAQHAWDEFAQQLIDPPKGKAFTLVPQEKGLQQG